MADGNGERPLFSLDDIGIITTIAIIMFMVVAGPTGFSHMWEKEEGRNALKIGMFLAAVAYGIWIARIYLGKNSNE